MYIYIIINDNNNNNNNNNNIFILTPTNCCIRQYGESANQHDQHLHRFMIDVCSMQHAACSMKSFSTTTITIDLP